MGARYHFDRAIAFRFVPEVGGSGCAPCGADSIGKQAIRARIPAFLTRKGHYLAANSLGRI
jgi:hypothetical protein